MRRWVVNLLSVPRIGFFAADSDKSKRMFNSLKAALLFLFLVLFSTASFAQNAALVVIDMQPFFAERGKKHTLPENQAKIDQILQRQRELIRTAKERNIPILMIEYIRCGPTCEALTREIGDYAHTRTFIKATDGMFAAGSGVVKDITDYLGSQNITKLIVSGANGGACVKCSIEGALNNGFQVWADPNAIADFNYAEFVYPYHYRDGQLSVSAELSAKFNQQTDLKTTFEEVLNVKDPSACISDGLGDLVSQH